MAPNSAIHELRKRLKGEVLLPPDAGYDAARQIYNAMIDRRPAVIARCTCTEDVAAAVRFAGEHGLPVSIKGGGHNVAGNAVCDGGVMIDCSPMKGISVDAKGRTAKAQPGLTLGDFDRATTSQGLFTTLGVVTKTGIAGLTLGGGLGWLAGKFGLACDNLVGAEVVTAEGKVMRANERENADLLWGLRGGGGNFGVVTEFVYRLHPVEPVIGGLLLHPLDRAREVMRFFREVASNCADELTVMAAFLDGPDGTPFCGLAVAYIGDTQAGERALEPLRKFGPPVADTVGPMEYVQLQSMFDEAYPTGRQHYWKSGTLKAASDDATDVMADFYRRRPSRHSQIFLEHWHGAASRVPQAATAFAGRRNHLGFSALGIWQEPKEANANTEWIKEFWKQMQPHLTPGVYVNYLGRDEGNRVREAYGPNYERLVTLKKKYDPTNFFRLNQNLVP